MSEPQFEPGPGCEMRRTCRDMGRCHGCGPAYADAAAQSARQEALEEAARICELAFSDCPSLNLLHGAARIRSLASSIEATGDGDLPTLNKPHPSSLSDKEQGAAFAETVRHGFHVFRDGNAWCAVGPHFQDLMKDKAGFGATIDEAIGALHRRFATDPWWRNKALPMRDEFTIHDAASIEPQVSVAHANETCGPEELKPNPSNDGVTELPEWQPIETAPKDEDVYFLGAVAGTKIATVTCWDEDESFYALNGVFKNWKPTHWMPLPAPPRLIP